MNPKTAFTALATSLALSLGACASSGGTPTKTQSGVLTDPAGMTLYVFDKDAAGSGKSMCNGKCAENWPPLAAAESDKTSGDFAVIAREDGKKQWAFKGKPLYFWSKDQKPGDTTGEGFNNVWHVAK